MFIKLFNHLNKLLYCVRRHLYKCDKKDFSNMTAPTLIDNAIYVLLRIKETVAFERYITQ